MRAFSFPSKTFLLGEYAALREGCALILAHEPCFSAEIRPPAKAPAFAPASAAGRAAAKLAVDLRTLAFRDPHAGKGGFGGSGAEFLSVVAAEGDDPGTEAFAWKSWELYKELGCAGSGADILTQAFARPGEVLSLEIAQRKLERLPSGALGLSITLYHTGKKLPTHQHLANAGELTSENLAQITRTGAKAFAAKDSSGFVQAINRYASELARLQLVAPHTAAALADLGKPSVLAAKGCGALGSDVLLVCTAAKPNLGAWAEAHSLVEVASLSI